MAKMSEQDRRLAKLIRDSQKWVVVGAIGYVGHSGEAIRIVAVGNGGRSKFVEIVPVDGSRPPRRVSIVALRETK